MSGWSYKTNQKRIEKIKRHSTRGDWRRFGMVNVKYVDACVKWERVDEKGENVDVLTFTTPVPVVMNNVILKMESAQNRVYKSLPTIVKEHFDLTSSNYQPKLFKVSVLQFQQ